MENNYDVFNLGTGCGFSVLEVVKGFEKALGKPLNYKFTERRHGDVPKLVANIDKATANLGWKVTKNLNDMCIDSVSFITKRFKIKSE
jgi:UDP-glucose 4-epimerase